MPSLAFHCRICSGYFGSRSAWLAHLLQEGHQNLARKELLLNWERSGSEVNQEERACALVVYGKVPVGKDDRVIQYLSQDALGVLVTDLVWWEGRPRVGVVQLESSDAVKKVMSVLTNGEFRIDPDQVCRVMDGSRMEELEWEKLLQGKGTDLNDPEVNGKGIPTPSSPDPDLTPSVALLVLTDDASSTDRTGSGATNAPEVSGELEIAAPAIPWNPASPVVAGDRNLNDEDQAMDNATGLDNDNSAIGEAEAIPTSGFNTDLALRDHLRTIIELIEIPDEEYDTALEIHSQLQQALCKYKRGKKFKKMSFDAVLTRNWLLKLQYKPTMNSRGKPAGGNLHLCILILKDVKNSDKCHNLFHNESKHIEKMLIKTEGGKTSFLSCEILGRVDSYCGRNSGVFSMKEPSTNLLFDVHIVSNPLCFGDYQVWRLAQSLLTFDPHCYPVLAAAYYWASINSVVVGGRTGSHEHLPDPSALNWLVVLFFQKEGLIPTAKEILERPHQSKCLLGKDIGFSDCFRTALAWRKERNTFVVDTTTEEFAKEVLTLLHKFFLFCGALLGEPDKGVVGDWGWILNTRDGEIIPKAEVLSPEGPKDCKLSDLELSEIKGALNGEEGSHRIIMLQPFFLNWRISTWNAEPAFGAMKETGMSLKGYLDILNQKVVKPEKLEWDEFLKLLKLQEEFVPLPEFLEMPRRIPFKRSLAPTDPAEVGSKKMKLEIPDEDAIQCPPICNSLPFTASSQETYGCIQGTRNKRQRTLVETEQSESPIPQQEYITNQTDRTLSQSSNIVQEPLSKVATSTVRSLIRNQLNSESGILDPPPSSFVCNRGKCSGSKVWATQNELISHIVSVHQEYKFKCSMCQKKFQTSSNLLKHQQSKHGTTKLPDGETEFRCEHCDKTYQRKESLQKHVRNKHRKLNY